MIYTPSVLAVIIFIFFVLCVLGLSFYFARKTKCAKTYFAAGGTIHWSVNGIAFAGDYLSAASFLGICGMIATVGYDGFLYSIGFLAGWVVALFVVAEPMKRLGTYTFTDAIDSNYNSKGIQLMAAVSTLIVSVCYLIPQMVGAGALVTPLLGLAHHWGVIIVGCVVIFIVATAGMTSTTYVQFIKGALLIIFSVILTGALLNKGLSLNPYPGYHKLQTLAAITNNGQIVGVKNDTYQITGSYDIADKKFIKLQKNNIATWWITKLKDDKIILEQTLSITKTKDGSKYYNGEPKNKGAFFPVGNMEKIVMDGQEVEKTGKLGPFKFLSTITKSTVARFTKKTLSDGDNKVSLWYKNPTLGTDIMRPGLKFKIDKGSDFMSKLNFISLMLALFFGTAALPHILIRYYTVPSAKCARKSTIVAIAAIGFFYILTLFMGLGAMVNGVLDVESNNMAAPLLAKTFGVGLFAIISAIAFATVLGTVSGLIVAASGAVAHDIIDSFLGIKLSDKHKVMAGKLAAIGIGIIAMILGILFKGMNVSYLVGWAFAVAASANLPAILMLLFWKKTTSKGITASIIAGIVSSLSIILLSPSMYTRYGLDPASAPSPLSNPGIISIPLSFLTLILVSLCTHNHKNKAAA